MHRPDHPRIQDPHRHDEDRGAETGARCQYGFDAAIGGARRDEEKSRAKERIFSFRSKAHRWDPKNQRPELWNLYNARRSTRARASGLSRSPTGPSSTSGATSLPKTFELVPLYFAQPRPIVQRDGVLIMRRRRPHAPGTGRKAARPKQVRFRTLGCYPLTGAVESSATTACRKVLSKNCIGKAGTSERQGRLIDQGPASGSMEKKKQEGYF
jgi:sulfate adenylyltransferase subunit 2